MEENTRLVKVFTYLKDKKIIKFQSDLAKKLDYSKAYIGDLLKSEKPETDELFTRIKDAYPELPEYLLAEEAKPGSDLTVLRKGDFIPFFKAPASAGNEYTDMQPVTQPVGYVNAGWFFKGCCGILKISGHSMGTKDCDRFTHGACIGLYPHHDSFIMPGEYYVIETLYQRVFKRLYYSDNENYPDSLECLSDNTEVFEKGARIGKLMYPSFYVPLADITRKYRVGPSYTDDSNFEMISFEEYQLLPS